MDSKQIGERIKYLREVLEITPQAMAAKCGISLEEYLAYEQGGKDYPFSFLHTVSDELDIDMVELLTGEGARLSSYTIDRKGTGLRVYRRSGLDYLQLAGKFKGKLMQPYVVSVPFTHEHTGEEIYTSGHEGQEFNFVLEGAIKITIDGKTEVLDEGDAIYYDSGKPHGMVASGGKDAKFLAILIKN